RVPHLSPLLLARPPPPPSIYPLSLHDALPIFRTGANRDDAPHTASLQRRLPGKVVDDPPGPREKFIGKANNNVAPTLLVPHQMRDRKSTRLNSSHVAISYAVFCLKKKTKHNNQ